MDRAAAVMEHVYAKRRARVLERLGESGALLLTAAPELHVGADGELRYFVDPYLYWLTGYTEPESALLLSPAQADAFTLFVRPRDAERELWSGVRGGLEAASERFGADRAFAITELGAQLPALLERCEALYYRIGSSGVIDGALGELLASARRARPRSGHGLHTITDPGVLLDELRLRKDAWEIERLRASCALAVEAFRGLRDVIRPGAGEWEVEAALDAGFRARGASSPAFPTIVGSGVNATVLHYTANSSRIGAGNVVLVDGGARHDMYCSDITRSYPADGRFSSQQRALYEVVLRAHDAGIAAARPGAPVSGVHEAAVRALVEGLIGLGFLAGDAGQLVTQPDAWRRFYPHRTSHWLGLDVHDVGPYLNGGDPVLLEPGMVLTVEPGLYIGEYEGSGPAALRATGIRLEDDVLVTGAGPEVLSAGLPLDPAALFG